MRLVWLIALVFAFGQSRITLKQIRECYYRAVKEKSEAIYLRRTLDTVSESSSPQLVCYKGAAEMINARYVINPITKMVFFTKGKGLIESSIFRDTSCLELRFVRFTIQHNLPAFLNYRQNMKQDSFMIAQNLLRLSDQDLKVRIRDYFARLKAGIKN
jgi:hypothetical protein